MISNGIFLSVWSHLAWSPLGPFMLFQVSFIHSFYGQVIFHCVYVAHLHYLTPVDAHLHCFHVPVFVTVNAVNTGVHVSFLIRVFCDFWMILRKTKQPNCSPLENDFFWTLLNNRKDNCLSCFPVWAIAGQPSGRWGSFRRGVCSEGVQHVAAWTDILGGGTDARWRSRKRRLELLPLEEGHHVAREVVCLQILTWIQFLTTNLLECRGQRTMFSSAIGTVSKSQSGEMLSNKWLSVCVE